MKAKRRSLLIASAIVLVLVGLGLWLEHRHVQLYNVSLLPSLGATFTGPMAINDHGQVAGFADIVVRSRYHLFIWDRDNGMKDLDRTDHAYVDINNAGQIAGTLTDPNGNKRAFIWDPKHGKQFLGTLGGADSFARALNNRGQVVGFLNPSKGRMEAFIWDRNAGMRKLLPNERGESRASAINDAGQILGFTGRDTSLRSPVAFFWDSTDASGGPAPPLPFLPSVPYSGGSYLNNNGYVLGRERRRDNKRTWTFLWRRETGVEGIEYLFPLEHASGHMRINDANQVLYGETYTSSLGRFIKRNFPSYTRHCLWDPKRGKIVLDKQVPPRMGTLVGVGDINNHGCIVGMIRSKTLERNFAVLLEPIPERWKK